MEIGLLNGRQSPISILTLIQVGYHRRDVSGETSSTFGETLFTIR
jgi:hypothetical protein